MPPLVYEPPSLAFAHGPGLKSDHSTAALASPLSVLVNIKVFGILKSAGYQRAKYIVEGLVQNVPEVFSAEFHHYYSFDYFERRAALKKDFPNLVDSIFPEVFILATASPRPTTKPRPKITSIPDIFAHKVEKPRIPTDLNPVLKYEPKDGGVLEKVKGSSLLTCERFVEWVQKEFKLKVKELEEGDTYEMMGEEAFLREISQIAHKFVYFDVQIDKVPIGRIIAEIYTDIVPETAAKFMSFVEGTAKHPYNHGELLKYSGTKVTRCIKEGWIQAGEFQTSNDDGPLVGETFGDENFIIHHTHRGQLSMVNYGAHSNYSQFMIVLKEMPYFNHKFVSIGRCIDGHHVLDIIEHHHTMTTTTLSTITPTTTAAAAADLATHTNGERPTKDIEFVNVGELII